MPTFRHLKRTRPWRARLAGFCVLAVLAFTGARADFRLNADHRWADSAKQAVGTAFGHRSSPVWFTVGKGIVNEVYYPRIDTAQIGDSQLLFSNIINARAFGAHDGKTRFIEEKRDFTHRVTHPGPIPRAIIKSRFESESETIEFTKEVVTDPSSPVLRVRYHFTTLPSTTRIFLLHKPTAANDGAHDRGKVLVSNTGTMVFNACDSQETGHCQSVTTSAKVLRASVGIVGETDGWQDLSRHGRMVNEIEQNGPGNIALTAELKSSADFEIAISFGSNQQESSKSLSKSAKVSFNETLRNYDDGWQQYHEKLSNSAWLDNVPANLKEDLLWNASIVKTHEDKSNPGAIIASLSIPYIPDGTGHPDGKNTGGYHLVWPRDLFKSALSLLRMGDVKTAHDAFKFMTRMERNGRISQNTWVDGRPFWTGEQMDQEAFPVLLAYELQQAGVKLDDSSRAFLDRRLARLRESSGWTGQERWEEAGGFSPNTIAVMAAALSRAGDQAGAKRLLDIALTRSVSYRGPLSTNPYFIRIAQNGQPDAGNYLHIANGGPALPEYQVIDGGFIEWLRWFPQPAQYFGEAGTRLDQIIENTLAVYDNPNNGVASWSNDLPLYRRYTADAYGLNRQGGPWPILTAERALPTLRADPRNGLKFVNDVREMWGPGDLCPEQLSPDLSPMPYGASPLVWCHAEMIELTYKSTRSN